VKMIILAVLMFVSVASSQNFWQRTEPYFAPLNRFSFAGGDTVYGALGSGFTRSVNNGDLWTAHLIVNYVTDMAVAPNGSIFMSQNQQKISRSTNKGNSFTVLGTGINETSCSSVLTTQTGSVLVGTQKGIYRSTNNGDTVGRKSPVQQNFREIQRLPHSLETVRISTPCRAATASILHGPFCFRSTDDGLTWSKGKCGARYSDFE
jgi:hypothetical protein